MVSETAVASGTTSEQWFVYDGNSLILTLDSPSGHVAERYLTGLAVDQVFAEENAATDTVDWLIQDNLGTVRDVVNYNPSTGVTSVVDHIQYDSYGNITSQTNAAAQPAILFTGQLWDSHSQLYYDNNRWYAPALGDFMSQDPSGFSGGDSNLMRYVGNDPTNAVDPTGLSAFGSPGVRIGEQLNTPARTGANNSAPPTSNDSTGSFLGNLAYWILMAGPIGGIAYMAYYAGTHPSQNPPPQPPKPAPPRGAVPASPAIGINRAIVGGSWGLPGWEGFYPYFASLPTWSDPIVNAAANGAAGFADTVSGGLTTAAREATGTNGGINTGSGAYKADNVLIG